jgi:nucleoside-diphosphate kinase
LALRDASDAGVRTVRVEFLSHVRKKVAPGRPFRLPFIAGVRPLTASLVSSVYVSAAVATERTLILVKPDAFERGLTGEVIARFERKGLSLVALKLMQADVDIANVHYEEHTDKPFFGELVEFITGGPLVAMVLEGPNAVKAARQVIGATDPVEADAGSIRGEFGTEVTFNLVHGSDSPESAEREIGIWFPEL